MLLDRLRDKKWIEIIMVLAMVAIGRTSGGGACVVEESVREEGTISADELEKELGL